MDFSIPTIELPPEAQDFFSRICPRCLMALRIGDWPMCPHEPARHYNVQDDLIPGGMTVENMGPEPLTFYSKSEWRAKQKELGLVQMVRHRPAHAGTDKSPHTSRWI